MKQRDAILDAVRALPALPTSASRLIRCLQDPEVNINDLIQKIEYDQGLTSNLLRLANSVYFAGPRSIGSVREALVRLGTRRIFQLVVTSTIAPFARRPVQGYDLSAGQLLEHAIAVAVGTEHLASVLEWVLPDHAFTAGLLHDMGKIVLGTFVEVDAGPIQALAFDQHVPFDEAELRVLGIDHAEVGAAVLGAWGLPSGVVDVVRWHHRPMEAPRLTPTGDLVHAADQLVTSSGVGAGVDGLNYRPCAEVMARLGLTPRAEEQTLSRTVEALDELRVVLGCGAEGR